MKSGMFLGLAAVLLAACSGNSAPANAQATDQPAGALVPPTSATDFTA